MARTTCVTHNVVRRRRVPFTRCEAGDGLFAFWCTLPGRSRVSVSVTQRADRLLLLSTYRRVLRHHWLTSPPAVRAASPQQLAGLGEHRADIVRLVEEAHGDVMALLFHPDERLWSVDALDLLHHTRRLLTFQFDSDDPAQERRMWAALRIVLGRS